MKTQQSRIQLGPEDTPKQYVNILPLLQEPLAPPLNPATGDPVRPQDLEALFPKECVRQEASTKRRIDIPQEVREILVRSGRPTPLQRALGLERELKTPCRIYYKREDVSPTGSHKLNTAVAQAYYAAKEGTERLATETGAGQWGSAVSLACSFFDIRAMVYMVRVSYEQKAHRGTLMRTYGAEIVPSPSDRTEFGKKFSSEHPDHPGTLGIAISEAIEDTVSHDDTKYTLGSVLNFVLLQQTVIGQEVDQQLRSVEEVPDLAIGCVGGGSNFGGMVYPLMADKRYSKTEYVAVEPKVCPSLTKGEYRYDFGDTARMTPKLKMYTLGADFTPPKIHAGGLRYHGVAPTISALVYEGLIRPISYEQHEVLEAGVLFGKTEGIIPAPESAHAVKAAIDYALEAKRQNEDRVLVFNLSGHGHFDMAAYKALLAGEI
ncbi:MAG: TrpB-like pyridoxal phosphate-dependent enzyme [Candidatus Thorarchaeota archaeon]|nr:MAG: TrpB-like pyridoxal phosphate-dependent enzyme [Candidatus Thorarchaeota archaeon]RLI58445.1 MAG: TrpB-like pyridoxal phosphate-dependent enzyme [Candidatus Thorarchaeota archaeon]